MDDVSPSLSDLRLNPRSNGAPRFPTMCDAKWIMEGEDNVVGHFVPSRYTCRRCKMKWQSVTLRNLVMYGTVTVVGKGEVNGDKEGCVHGDEEACVVGDVHGLRMPSIGETAVVEGIEVLTISEAKTRSTTLRQRNNLRDFQTRGNTEQIVART